MSSQLRKQSVAGDKASAVYCPNDLIVAGSIIHELPQPTLFQLINNGQSTVPGGFTNLSIDIGGTWQNNRGWILCSPIPWSQMKDANGRSFDTCQLVQCDIVGSQLTDDEISGKVGISWTKYHHTFRVQTSAGGRSIGTSAYITDKAQLNEPGSGAGGTATLSGAGDNPYGQKLLPLPLQTAYPDYNDTIPPNVGQDRSLPPPLFGYAGALSWPQQGSCFQAIVSPQASPQGVTLACWSTVAGDQNETGNVNYGVNGQTNTFNLYVLVRPLA